MSSIEDLSSKSAAEIGRALAARRGGAQELAELCLDRIAAQASPVFLKATAERAMTEARGADARLAAGRPLSPLDGVPVAWKDLIDMAGETTTAGSAVMASAAPASRDARVVHNLTAVGMVNLGRLNMTEFAYSGLGLNPHHGTPVNPRGTGEPRVPGGSSSGSGVAVASGMSPCAIGTDTGGSVRVPAAFNGITGYMSSQGLVPKDGVFPLSATLDTVGPLGRSVEDCALIAAAMLGRDIVTPKPMEVSALRLYVPETIVLDDLEPEIAAAFEVAVEALARAGAQIERGPFAPFAKMTALSASHGSIAAAEAYLVHRELVDGPQVSRIDERVVDRIMPGKQMLAHDLLSLQNGRAALQRETADLLDGRMLIMPTVAHVAPRIAPLEADKALFHKVNLKTLRNTMIGNLLNLPGVAMPCGSGEDDMPVSLLLSSIGGDDKRLLRAVSSVERIIA
ncbi:amidase [Hoeflea sp. G2-23]|uniref:Indoleacetamide hydrolase n=1 Tax=Hoeflea algicola TaxID=2983763 RepID=A0ABT3Z4L4_9HYPH|nr:amidase [Hoeflea algicola]MCY0146707.1 amidase [Hoeflea algicola]